MKLRQAYEGRVIEARSCELKDGGWDCEFSIEWALGVEAVDALTVWWARGGRHGNITSSLPPRLQKDSNCTAYVR
jgi:hypothetical protein